MKLRPLNDHLVVKALPKEEVTKSGIILPETTSKERPEQGEVIAVGPGRMEDGKLFEMTVKVGEKIVFKKYAPEEVKVEDEEFLLISERDVLAVLE